MTEWYVLMLRTIWSFWSMTEDGEMLVWHGCVLRRAGCQGRAGPSPTLFYVFPLRTANLIINFLLLNLGTDSKFLGLFSFSSLLPAFSVPLPIRVKFSSKGDLCGPHGPFVSASPGRSSGALPQKYASSRREVLTRHNVRVSSAEKTSDSLAGWEHPPWTVALIVPTAYSPGMRKSRLPEVVCLNFHLKERRNLWDLIFSLPGNLKLTSVLEFQSRDGLVLLAWEPLLLGVNCPWHAWPHTRATCEQLPSNFLSVCKWSTLAAERSAVWNT